MCQAQPAHGSKKEPCKRPSCDLLLKDPIPHTWPSVILSLFHSLVDPPSHPPSHRKPRVTFHPPLQRGIASASRVVPPGAASSPHERPERGQRPVLRTLRGHLGHPRRPASDGGSFRAGETAVGRTKDEDGPLECWKSLKGGGASGQCVPYALEESSLVSKCTCNIHVHALRKAIVFARERERERLLLTLN